MKRKKLLVVDVRDSANHAEDGSSFVNDVAVHLFVGKEEQVDVVLDVVLSVHHQSHIGQGAPLQHLFHVLRSLELVGGSNLLSLEGQVAD